MVVSESSVQASCARKSGQVSVRGIVLVAAGGWLLAGCSTLSSVNPVNWWHRQEGGKIAEQRPEPPGADQPYPNLATVPAKPEAPDADALKKLTDSLVADRTYAQHAAQSAPLADPSSPAASPSLFGIGSAPPPPPATSTAPAPSGRSGILVASASMPAVNAPPPSAASAPSAAPRKPVTSRPLDAPTEPAATSVTPEAPRAAASPPALPSGAPTRPAIAGAPPITPAAAAAPMPSPSPGPSAAIVFLPGASNLSQPAAEEVKAFAAKRGRGTIAVTGYGDVASGDPDAQSAAVNLGLSRAQSIVDALKADGVPGEAIRVSAEASGRGASLHLLQ